MQYFGIIKTIQLFHTQAIFMYKSVYSVWLILLRLKETVVQHLLCLWGSFVMSEK